jgi:hypothetical protein
MPTTMLGAIRKRLLTPPMDATSFATRGFPVDTPARAVLEETARHVTMGFEIAIEQKSVEAVGERLELLENQFRGLGYEGAGMALALRDAMSPRPGTRKLDDFYGVGGPGAHQIFMGYIGIGFALSYLPRSLWRRAMPDQSRLPESPAVSWMILDGYGFHEAYFKTDKWVHQQYLSPPLPWRGPHDYVLRVIDQGVGRAMWFVNGGDVDRLTAMIRDFAPGRASDLWCGAALAATYAGGVGEEELVKFAKNSWEFRAEVAQGAVFAIKQRVLSDLVTAHTELASQVFCERSAESAADLTEPARADLPEGSSIPAYEIFRQRIQSHFSA